MGQKAMHGGDIYRNPVRLDFSVNVNPLGIPEGVMQALIHAAQRVQEYPDMEAAELIGKLSERLSVPEETILLGNGASELLMAVVHALKPSKIVLPVPSFYGYRHVAKAAGSAIVPYPLRRENGFGVDEDLFALLRRERPELLILTNPNNPTGVLTSGEYLQKLLETCKATDTRLLLDECFMEFCGESCSMLEEAVSSEQLMVLRAFTKIYAIPGARLGYLICGNEGLRTKIREQLPEWNVSTLAQEAGMACLTEETKDYLVRTVQYTEQERQFLEGTLQEIGLDVYHGNANFILFYSEQELYDKLLKKGILIRDCSDYEGLCKGYYRIAVKRHEENLQLLNAIKECLT